MTAARPPLAALGRIAAQRATAPVAGERCEMCTAPVAEEHPHVVDTTSRRLLCTCRPCALLFTDPAAEQRFRTVPDRWFTLEGFRLGPAQWDALEIPVGLAFLFWHSGLGRTVAFYPGPAGAAECELPLGAWEEVAAQNPAVAGALPDVEAFLVRAPAPGRPHADAHLVPVDACYALVGRLRRVWRGFDGGQDARAALEEFFAEVAARSRAVPAGSPLPVPAGGCSP